MLIRFGRAVALKLFLLHVSCSQSVHVESIKVRLLRTLKTRSSFYQEHELNGPNVEFWGPQVPHLQT